MTAHERFPPADRAQSAVALIAVGCLFLLWGGSRVPFFWWGLTFVSELLGSGSALASSVVGIGLVTAGIEMRVVDGNPRGAAVLERLSALCYRTMDRPYAPEARTLLVTVGTALVVLAVGGTVQFFAADIRVGDTATAISLFFVAVLLLVYLGTTAIGLGLSFPRHGGRFTVPPPRFSPLERVLVASGTFLTATLPLTVLTALVVGTTIGGSLGSTTRLVTALGLEAILFGVLSVGVSTVRRRATAVTR